jgi:hypothetical protein
LYFPASHAEQTLPFAPVYPALHKQSVRETLPGLDDELPGHALHVSGPVWVLYFPAAHSQQALPLTCVNPPLHAQLSLFALPATDVKFWGQG